MVEAVLSLKAQRVQYYAMVQCTATKGISQLWSRNPRANNGRYTWREERAKVDSKEPTCTPFLLSSCVFPHGQGMQQDVKVQAFNSVGAHSTSCKKDSYFLQEAWRFFEGQ
eukprot:6180802-Pleurochrysis_carterae.AAC.3